MTLAICIACGDEKIGAWDECTSCGFMPSSEDEQMLSLALSDWFLPGRTDEWEMVRRQIKAGERPALDDEILQFCRAAAQDHQASSCSGFGFADADNPTNGYATLEAFRKANPELSIDQAEAIWGYMSPFIRTATTEKVSGASDPVYAAFVVRATGPAEKLQEWVSSCRGYMYSVNEAQKSADTPFLAGNIDGVAEQIQFPIDGATGNFFQSLVAPFG